MQIYNIYLDLQLFMPKYLTIIRHAKSSWENPELDDLVRPLNERGRQSIKIIGNYLREHKIKPDLVITSPATRALQTAIGISEILNYPKESLNIKQDIYFGTSSAILSVLENMDDIFKDVFLFGHEPLLSSLIEILTGKNIDKFPTCAVCRISLDITKWKNLKLKNSKCEFYVNPKILNEK